MKLKNHLSIIAYLLLFSISFAQVGVFNDKPRGALDINYENETDYTSPYGLVLPTNDEANIVTPQGDASTVVPGTMIFDNVDDCVKVRLQAAWSECLMSEVPETDPITALDCDGATHNGTLTEGTSASGVSSVISYTDGDGSSYSGQSVASTGVTGLTAELSAGSFASGDGTLTYNITGTPSGAGTASFEIEVGGQSCTLTRTVNPSAPLNAPGTGSLSGRTCFDIARSNDNINSCGALSGRIAQQADFTLAAINTQTYTFTPVGTVSNVRFMYINTNGSVITSLSGGNSGNNISTAVSATVNYNTNLNVLAFGLTSSNPLTADIYVIYNDGATNNGTDRQIKITANVKDCACCGAYISPTEWKEFLCHNLGADTSLDPNVPVVGLQGAYIQWGKRGPNTTGDSRVDWQTAPNDGPNGFAAAPTAGNPNAGPISGWNVTPEMSSTAWGFGGAKTANDPCPAGYRVPSITEWGGVVANNTASRTGTWTDGTTQYGSALHYGSNASSKTLTLPAAGSMFSGSNGLLFRGLRGNYWSNTELNPGQASHLTVEATTAIAVSGNWSNKELGLSIRCIKE